MCSVNIECVLLLQNVFSYYRMTTSCCRWSECARRCTCSPACCRTRSDWVQSLGFRVQGLGLCLGFRGQGLGLSVQGTGLRNYDLGFSFLGFRFSRACYCARSALGLRAQGLGFRARAQNIGQDLGFRVQGLGFRVQVLTGLLLHSLRCLVALCCNLVALCSNLVHLVRLHSV